MAAIVLTGMVTPEATDIYNQILVGDKAPPTTVSANPTTLTTFELPLVNYRVSQKLSFWHRGVDLTAPLGTPVYAIESGVVAEAFASGLGYGKHVIINHEHGVKSLYAHLSEVKVERGNLINRGELLGKVGATGWATGNHLHLEIYQKGELLNPLEVLPIKTSEIKYDGAYQTVNNVTSASPSGATLP